MFAALYHIQHKNYTEDLPFWLNLAGQSGGPVLELGCGTGRVLIPLAEAGYPVIGLDIDFAMLQFAARRISQPLSERIALFQADMANFHLSTKLGAIFLPCNTLSILQTPILHDVLACAQRHLAPSGLFAASLPNPRLLASLPDSSDLEVEETFPHPQDGRPVQVSSAWKRKGQIFEVTWVYDHQPPDGQVERLLTTIQQQIQPIEFYLQAFSAAGFGVVKIYGDFRRRAYRKTSPHLIFVATKD